nr:protein-glutamate O-methyltransferase CheR [Rhodoligotrophos appendicifer]
MKSRVSDSWQGDPAFARLKKLIIDRTGHAYFDDKDSALWERIKRRLVATQSSSSDDYMAFLQDSRAGEAEWARLEAEITIGETFFFRYLEQFAALRTTILPDIVQRNAESRRIRIWSAGCSTGAETYSIAIVLKELLAAEFDAWRVRIVGTDINEDSLAVARHGWYGQWALRTVSSAERSKYFVVNPEGKQWRIRPEFHSIPAFERHNLLSLLNDTSPLQFSDFDLILCRNVLIYFEPDTAIAIMGKLRDRLAPDGWLLVGTAEPSPIFSGMLGVVTLPGTIAYRRSEILAAEETHLRGGFEDTNVRPIEPGPGKAISKSPTARAKKTSKSIIPAVAPEKEQSTPVDEVKDLAGRGDLTAALLRCREILRKESENPLPHYYEGLITQALADQKSADLAFRKAIYLDKGFIMAHFQLGLLKLREGDRQSGRRFMINAVRLANALPDHSLVDEGNGLSVLLLKQSIALHLGQDATG